MTPKLAAELLTANLKIASNEVNRLITELIPEELRKWPKPLWSFVSKVKI